MKIETILNAMTHVALRVVLNDEPNKGVDIRHRQYHAFRARILRMDAEKNDVIEGLFKSLDRQHKEIVKLRNEVGTWEEIDDLAYDWMEDTEAQDDSNNN